MNYQKENTFFSGCENARGVPCAAGIGEDLRTSIFPFLYMYVFMNTKVPTAFAATLNESSLFENTGDDCVRCAIAQIVG